LPASPAPVAPGIIAVSAASATTPNRQPVRSESAERPPPQEISAPSTDSAPPPPALPVNIPAPQAPVAQPTPDIAPDTDTDTRTAGVASPETPLPDVVTPPVRTRMVSPDYPSVARAAQLEGDVVLRAIVSRDGKVSDVEVLQPVHPVLDEAARKAVLRYEYTPGRRNGIAEPAVVRITVSFRLH